MPEISIYAEDVNKHYGSLAAVKDLSFSVEKATCFGFLGPNGAGKTTMMKVLYGINQRDDSSKSTVNVLGYDPEQNELEIKYLTGIVPQEDNLDVELSVVQNLLIYARFYGMDKKAACKRIDELLEFMELTEKRKSKIRELSGGMKRRLIIARALINRPKLLILDEPTTGLDPQVRHLIWDRLIDLKHQGTTILLTTHYMEEAFQICDRLIIMHNGEKVIEGIPKDLVEQNMEKYVMEVYRKSLPENIRIPDHVRLEETESRILLYADKANDLEVFQEELDNSGYYLRQTNLEDLFLKTTGRNLNE
ncbi:MAG: ABC transporter ATP-binding protein [Spirochaetia bacterium]